MKAHSAFLCAMLASSALASLDYINPQLVTTSSTQVYDEATNIVSPDHDSFNSCDCDLTPQGCDAECCCDQDCPENTLEAWTLAGYCTDYVAYGAAMPYAECIDRYSEPILQDLRGGLNIYEKIYRQLLCTRRENVRAEVAKFEDK